MMIEFTKYQLKLVLNALDAAAWEAKEPKADSSSIWKQYLLLKQYLEEKSKIGS